MDRWLAIVCHPGVVVKIPQQRAFQKAEKQEGFELFRCLPTAPLPEYLEYFTCAAGVKDAVREQREREEN